MPVKIVLEHFAKTQNSQKWRAKQAWLKNNNIKNNKTRKKKIK